MQLSWPPPMRHHRRRLVRKKLARFSDWLECCRISGGSHMAKLTFHGHSAMELPDGAPRYMGPSCGAIIKGDGKTVYHMGDTGLFSDIKLIAERYGPVDVACVPCGDRFTMGLEDAAIAAGWINAKTTLPIH